MARPGLRNNRKFRRLKAILKMPSVYVAAHLQAMWDVAYENGDPVLGDKVDVELCAEWEDSGRGPGEWFDAAKEAGFIDESSEGKYTVHDLFDHAPDYVRKRASREKERRRKSEPNLFAQKEEEPAEPEKEKPAPKPVKFSVFTAFKQFWISEWERQHKDKCVFSAKHGSIATKILEQLGAKKTDKDLPADQIEAIQNGNVAVLERAKLIVSAYMREGTDFYSGHPLSKLLGSLEVFVAKAAGGGIRKANTNARDLEQRGGFGSEIEAKEFDLSAT